MITTSQPERVLNALKYFQAEYPQGVPRSILKLDLELSEEDLDRYIRELELNKHIECSDNLILLKKIETNKVELEVDVDLQLTEKEKNATEIIQNLLDDDDSISKHILEGNLMYGDLKLSNVGVYNLLTSLENKGVLSLIQKNDGEYYTYLSQE